MMSIEMAGAVYCPLSPRDPHRRLHILLTETQCRLVLVHELTRDKLGLDHRTIDIDTTVNIETMLNDMDPARLSDVRVGGESLAYTIFTSGSTGTPKAVSFSFLFRTITSCNDYYHLRLNYDIEIS